MFEFSDNKITLGVLTYIESYKLSIGKRDNEITYKSAQDLIT